MLCSRLATHITSGAPGWCCPVLQTSLSALPSDTWSNLPSSSGRDAEPCPGGERGRAQEERNDQDGCVPVQNLLWWPVKCGSPCLRISSALCAPKPISPEMSHYSRDAQLPRKVSFQQVPVLVVRNSSSLGMQEEDPLQVRGVQDWPFICPYGSQEWGLFSTAVLPALLEQQTHCAEERGWAGSHRAGLSSAVGSLGCL